MKTVQEFVTGGIASVAELGDALQTAMRLEFSTIPPYLCAQWSIDSDPDGVGDMIEQIVIQEMVHFALAGNMLTGIGGVPAIANASFIPSYPTKVLPGDIAQLLPVDLKPLSRDQLKVFMQIEKPEFTPVPVQPLAKIAPAPATIGDFYNVIAAAFTALAPPIVPNAHAVNGHGATPIRSIADAQLAIAKIKSQGEGTAMSPDQVQAGAELVHYYAFEQILLGQTLSFVNGKLRPVGPPIAFPTVFDFRPSAAVPNPSLAFNQLLSRLLIDLQSCWTTGSAVNIQAMRALEAAGTALITQHIQPQFVWAAPA
jgi:hypothetical protein